MAKRKNTKGQTMIYKNEDRVTRTPLKQGLNSGASEGLTVPAPLVAPVMLNIIHILHYTRVYLKFPKTFPNQKFSLLSFSFPKRNRRVRTIYT